MITAVSTATVADAQAARNWAANLRALAVAQPGFADRVQSTAVLGEWLFARDGSLTLRQTPGQWVGGCSLPYRAGMAMLRTLDPRGSVLCMLAPLHAAEIKGCLEKITPQQAVIVLQPDVLAMRVILACEDFSAALSAGRLHFVTGDDWTDDLRKLFTDQPGLPTPQQFVKLPTLPAEVADPLIAGSQAIFAAANAQRTERIVSLRNTPRASAGIRTITVIAGSRFGLWDDAAERLASALGSENVRRLDPDRPTFSSPLATAEFCAQADALVTADIARCDFPDVLSKDLPWVTWVTRGRIPAPATAGTRDALLVADATWKDAAIKAGWDARRVDTAGFPTMTPTPAADAFAGWTILADTVAVKLPKQLDEFSSHKLLWESIEHDLRTNPYAVEDINSYLHKRCRAMNLDEATIDRRLFIDSLLVPAYQQGLVRALAKSGVSLKLYGAGWTQIDEFRPIAAGPIRSRAELDEALTYSGKLIHVSPTAGFHPILATGLPVLRRRVSLLDAFIREAKAGVAPAIQQPLQPMSVERVRKVLEA